MSLKEIERKLDVMYELHKWAYVFITIMLSIILFLIFYYN